MSAIYTEMVTSKQSSSGRARILEAAIELVAGSARLPALAPSLALRVPAGWDELFMDVALGVPVYRWTRPRSLEGAHRPIEQLLEAIGATA